MDYRDYNLLFAFGTGKRDKEIMKLFRKHLFFGLVFVLGQSRCSRGRGQRLAPILMPEALQP